MLGFKSHRVFGNGTDMNFSEILGYWQLDLKLIGFMGMAYGLRGFWV